MRISAGFGSTETRNALILCVCKWDVPPKDSDCVGPSGRERVGHAQARKKQEPLATQNSPCTTWKNGIPKKAERLLRAWCPKPDLLRKSRLKRRSQRGLKSLCRAASSAGAWCGWNLSGTNLEDCSLQQEERLRTSICWSWALCQQATKTKRMHGLGIS